MKIKLCIALFCMAFVIMGCGDKTASQSEAELNTNSSSESYNTEQSSEVFSESDAESVSEEDLNGSSAEESIVTSDTAGEDNSADINSEVEIDFSEFE